MGANAPYTGPGSPVIDLKTASPSNPQSMFSEDVEYTLVGRGGGLGSAGSNNNYDDLSYYYTTMTGDGVFSCRVRYVAGTSADGGNAGAGIMVRSSLAPDARNITVLLTDGNGVTFQWRPQDNQAEEAWPMSIAIGVGAPTWVRLEKKGDTWTVTYSQHGQTWYNPTSVTVALPSGQYYVGLAATSHDPKREVVDLFDHVSGFTPKMYVSITPPPTPPSSSSS